jgi:hypothetical protein
MTSNFVADIFFGHFGGLGLRMQQVVLSLLQEGEGASQKPWSQRQSDRS